jgi:hypothetical protein
VDIDKISDPVCLLFLAILSTQFYFIFKLNPIPLNAH